MLRSVGAIVAGYVVFAVSAVLLFQLSGQDSHAPAALAFKIAATVWGAVFALVGGWLTAHVSVREPAIHGAWLGGLIATIALISLLARPSDASWSQISAIVVMAPCAWLGGVLAAKQKAT